MKRIGDMGVDKYHFYDIRPAAIPGLGSWLGHIFQFKVKSCAGQSMDGAKVRDPDFGKQTYFFFLIDNPNQIGEILRIFSRSRPMT